MALRSEILLNNTDRSPPSTRQARRSWLPAVFVVLGMLTGVVASEQSARASDGLYCEGKIVSKGDSSYRVRQLCGNPDDVSERVVRRSVKRRVTGPCDRRERERESDRSQSSMLPFAVDELRVKRCSYYEKHEIEVIITRWTYDFGRNRLVHHLDFEDEQLVRVFTSGYGDKAPAN